MPRLRKRRAVSYAGQDDSNDEDEDAEVAEVEPVVKRKARPRKPVVRKTVSAGTKSQRSTNSLVLSDSDVDSEEEATPPPPPPRRRSVPAPKRQKVEPEVSPYFDWTSVLERKSATEQPNVKTKIEKSDIEDEDDDDDDEEEEDDWEEVDIVPEETPSEEKVTWEGEQQTLEISMDPSALKKERKRKSGGRNGAAESELEAEFRRAWQKCRREAHADMHLVHLLCLLAHGRYLSAKLLHHPLVSALALSVVPEELTGSEPEALRKLELLLEFASAFADLKKKRDKREGQNNFVDRIAAILGRSSEETSLKVGVLAVCAIMRAAGMRTRLVHAFNPVPLMPPKEQPPAPKEGGKKKRKAKPKQKRFSSDSDFENSGQMLSEDEEEKEAPHPCTSAWWLEVLCADRWVCVDCERCQLDHPEEMERREVKQGVLYVVAFEADGSCRDVTARYARHWCGATRKARLSKADWEDGIMEALSAEGDRLLYAKEEDAIREQLLQQPKPLKVADYKNHPLYALTQHLTKFQVLYPPDAQPLHFLKGVPVYPRENVLLCHTRETWLKEARVVRIGEEAVKIVDARSNQRYNGTPPKIELFGRWQTEDFDPPEAVDGIVPKNEHGNVYLFQPSMLPKGCVHLRLNGLGRIRRRLGVDMAQAMMGWDFHGGRRAYPVFDGWVVCKENASIVRLAWLEAERESARKAAAKREERALANWRLLTKGLLIRERLSRRYDMKGEAACISSIAAGMKERHG